MTATPPDLAPLRWLWAFLEPVLAPPAQLDNTWAAGLTVEEMRAWAHRWARAT